MQKKHGPWTIRDSQSRYRSELIEVFEDSVINPAGEPDTYTTVRIKAGSSVLALDEEGFVHLSSEFRYAVGRESLETVSGAIDEGEEPLEAARRELREELGIEAAEWTSLGTVDPMPSAVDSPSHLFLARQLELTEAEQESAETIRRVKLRLEEAVRMVMDGRITHGSSAVLILKTAQLLKKSNSQ